MRRNIQYSDASYAANWARSRSALRKSISAAPSEMSTIARDALARRSLKYDSAMNSPSATFVNANPPGRRILVHYLEREPLAVAEDFRVRRDEWRAAGRLPDFDGGVKPLFSGPLETIVPWKWDWFEVAG